MLGSRPLTLRNMVKTSTTARPAEITNYTTQTMINVYAAVDGRDLGGVAGEVEKRVQAIEKDLPKGSHIAIRGQVQIMKNSFAGLGFGLLGAIVLAYLLFVVNFHYCIVSFIIFFTLPLVI